MQSLIGRIFSAGRQDPAPSRWAWRMQRLMLTPAFRFGLRVGVPFAVMFGAGAFWFSDPARRLQLQDAVIEARASFEERPEFMVQMMAVDGVAPELAAEIRKAVPLDFPQSSFDLDLTQIRSTVAALAPVKSVRVRIRPGGVLELDVEPRIPVLIWRSRDGLVLLDETGAIVSGLESRALRPDLPLIAGDEARTQVAEALELYAAALPLGGRLRGLVRVGERRWDAVLDRDQRILLPETGALEALERVIAMEGAQDVLSRDVAQVDLRLAARPTVQMKEEATKTWWLAKENLGQ